MKVRLERNDARMVKWICNIRPEDKISAEELKTRIKLKSMRECLQDKRPKWLGHFERMEESVWYNKCRTFKISGRFPEENQGNKE